MTTQAPQVITDVLVGGDQYVVTVTFQVEGSALDLDDYTLTCDVVLVNDPTVSVSPALVETTPASGIATVTLSPTNTSALLPAVSYPDYFTLYQCVGDVKAVKDADPTVVHHSPAFGFWLRRPVTA